MLRRSIPVLPCLTDHRFWILRWTKIFSLLTDCHLQYMPVTVNVTKRVCCMLLTVYMSLTVYSTSLTVYAIQRTITWLPLTSTRALFRFSQNHCTHKKAMISFLRISCHNVPFRAACICRSLANTSNLFKYKLSCYLWLNESVFNRAGACSTKFGIELVEWLNWDL